MGIRKKPVSFWARKPVKTKVSFRRRDGTNSDNNTMILNLGCGNEYYGNIRLDFVNTNASNVIHDVNKPLPFRNSFFDEIYCRSLLEHVGNVKQLVDECYRVLKLGGKIWVRTDNASYIPFHLKNHMDYITYNHTCINDKHYYLFKKEHLFNLFSDFKKVETIYTAPNKKLFFLPLAFKAMHVEVFAVK